MAYYQFAARLRLDVNRGAFLMFHKTDRIEKQRALGLRGWKTDPYLSPAVS